MEKALTRRLFHVDKKGRPQPPFVLWINPELLGQTHQMVHGALDFGVGQVGSATLRRHRALAANRALVERFFTGCQARCPGSLVIRLRCAGNATVMASATNRVVNRRAILRAAGNGSGGFGQGEAWRCG